MNIKNSIKEGSRLYQLRQKDIQRVTDLEASLGALSSISEDKLKKLQEIEDQFIAILNKSKDSNTYFDNLLDGDTTVFFDEHNIYTSDFTFLDYKDFKPLEENIKKLLQNNEMISRFGKQEEEKKLVAKVYKRRGKAGPNSTSVKK